MLSALPVALAITVFVFMLIHLAPGDPAVLLAPEGSSDAEVDLMRQRMGLDKPVHIQYLKFLSGMLTGDFGDSYYYAEPVTSKLQTTLPATYELALLAAVIAAIVAVPIGVISALRQNSLVDNAAMSAAFFGVSMPHFWFGILAVMLFGGRLGWLPVAGRITYGVDLHSVTGFYLLDSVLTGNWAAFKDVLQHLILPAVTLASSPAAAWSRLVRSAMLEAIHSDYIRTARAKGLSQNVVVWKHAFRNALLPVVTMMGLQMRVMLGGSIITETVFGYPGMGRVLVTAIRYRDYFLVLGIVSVFALTSVLLNLAVDLSYALIDPRIQYS